jgi:hypothetical protein
LIGAAWGKGVRFLDRHQPPPTARIALSPHAARRRLEEEYLTYHRWFREHGLHIPEPGWRSEYVEEILALSYQTLLGD